MQGTGVTETSHTHPQGGGRETLGKGSSEISKLISSDTSSKKVKSPKPSQTVLPPGNQVFSHMSLRGHSHSSHHTEARLQTCSTREDKDWRPGAFPICISHLKPSLVRNLEELIQSSPQFPLFVTTALQAQVFLLKSLTECKEPAEVLKQQAAHTLRSYGQGWTEQPPWKKTIFSIRNPDNPPQPLRER